MTSKTDHAPTDNPHEWHRSFMIIGRIDGHWVFCRWVEIRVNYFRPHWVERRLIRREGE
jgi:hypothetical protein